MYTVIIQNVNQIYFSLQSHSGKRLSLTQYEIKTFKGLTLEEANSYKKFIPLGLSVFIQEDKSFISTDFNIIDTDESIENTSEVVEDKNSFIYTIEDLHDFKKEEIKKFCLDVNIDVRRKTKLELINELVDYYGL